jgi:hypothetical protein
VKVRLVTDTSHGRAGALVAVDEREADRLLHAGAAYPVERMLQPETAAVVPPESAAARDARPTARKRGGR